MKVPAVREVQTDVKFLTQTAKKSKVADVKTIKNYAQYLRVYGLDLKSGKK